MLSQIAYVRQQIASAQRAGTPSARADHLERALDGLARVESQAQDIITGISEIAENISEDEPADPFLPPTDPEELREMIERAR